MIRNVQRTWFEVWGEEAAQNRILKAFLLFFVLLCAIETIALTFVSLRKPLLFGFSAESTRQIMPSIPSREILTAEVRRVVKYYALSRHSWDWIEIDNKMKIASNYVDTAFAKQFTEATIEQVKIAKEKRISQRFYFQDPEINLDYKSARVSGDRILLVSGLRAANPMTIEVGFTLGARTSANPEGVYIISEKLIST